MKQLLLMGGLTLAGLALLVACGSDTSVNVNANRMANSAGNAANTVANMASNAANAVANTASSAMTPSPESFMTDTAQSGMAEVEMGKLAAQKAKDPDVKRFGQMMVTDHTAANNELKAIAGKKNFQLPADMGSFKSDVDDLGKLAGAEFDEEYVEHMVDAHETDVANFERMANNGSDAELKAFAAKTLPVLKKHLEEIKRIQAKLSGSGGNSNGNANAARK